MNDYEVGKGKPPLHSRFKAGNQEWRKRESKRPDEQRFSPGEDIKAVLSAIIKVQQNGRTTSERRLRGIVRKLIADALQGRVSAANDLLTMRMNAVELGHVDDVILIFDAPGDDTD